MHHLPSLESIFLDIKAYAMANRVTFIKVIADLLKMYAEETDKK